MLIIASKLMSSMYVVYFCLHHSNNCEQIKYSCFHILHAYTRCTKYQAPKNYSYLKYFEVKFYNTSVHTLKIKIQQLLEKLLTFSKYDCKYFSKSHLYIGCFSDALIIFLILESCSKLLNSYI